MMRHRYKDLFPNATGRVDGQKFVKLGQTVMPADLDALRRVRDNELPNTPHRAATQADIATMFNSRKRGA